MRGFLRGLMSFVLSLVFATGAGAAVLEATFRWDRSRIEFDVGPSDVEVHEYGPGYFKARFTYDERILFDKPFVMKNSDSNLFDEEQYDDGLRDVFLTGDILSYEVLESVGLAPNELRDLKRGYSGGINYFMIMGTVFPRLKSLGYTIGFGSSMCSDNLFSASTGYTSVFREHTYYNCGPDSEGHYNLTTTLTEVSQPSGPANVPLPGAALLMASAAAALGGVGFRRGRRAVQ